jgi:hypothetical protein
MLKNNIIRFKKNKTRTKRSKTRRYKNIIESYEFLKQKRVSVNPNEKMVGAINLLLESDIKLII